MWPGRSEQTTEIIGVVVGADAVAVDVVVGGREAQRCQMCLSPSPAWEPPTEAEQWNGPIAGRSTWGIGGAPSRANFAQASLSVTGYGVRGSRSWLGLGWLGLGLEVVAMPQNDGNG